MPLVSCDTSVPYASVRRIVCAKGGLKIGRVGNDGKVRVVLAGTGFLYCINIYSNMYKSAVASYHTEVKRNFAVSCTVDVLEEGKGGGGGIRAYKPQRAVRVRPWLFRTRCCRNYDGAAVAVVFIGGSIESGNLFEAPSVQKLCPPL